MPLLRKFRLPRLPQLAEQKLSKTGYTRGATVREIYQNRVSRNNTVLIPWRNWTACRSPDDGSLSYENGFIVLVEPTWYFETPDSESLLDSQGLALGENALLFYKRRSEWVNFNPNDVQLQSGKPLVPAIERFGDLGGTYVARIHATVSNDGLQIAEGFNATAMRGAGIRVFEYASSSMIDAAKLQLEVLMWFCFDVALRMSEAGMAAGEAASRKAAQIESAKSQGLLDCDRLHLLRMIDGDGATTCPLCLEPISAQDFMKRLQQAEGRETHDLTTTEVSLFHIEELRYGKLQHKVYNLGWGHHHCNVVAKDAGIMPTLLWMKEVISRQPRDDLSLEKRLVEKTVRGD